MASGRGRLAGLNEGSCHVVSRGCIGHPAVDQRAAVLADVDADLGEARLAQQVVRSWRCMRPLPDTARQAARYLLRVLAAAATATMSESPGGRGTRTRKASRKTAGYVGRQIDDAVGHDQFNALVTAAGVRSRPPELDVIERNLAALTRPSQHLRGHVDADDVTGRSDLSRGKKGIEAGAAPRSSTRSPGWSEAMACGLPQPSPRSAPSGTLPRSISE